MTQLTEEHFHLIDSNKARRHEQLKKERQAVYNSCDLNEETKDIMIEIATTKGTHKLRDVIHKFFSKE